MPSDPLKEMKQAAELDLDVGEKPPSEEKPREPWEQRPDETGKAYEAFKKFLDLGVTRSIAEVVRQNEDIKDGTAHAWSAAHEWWVRAKAWDAMKQRQRTAGVKAAITRTADMEAEALELATKIYTENWKRLSTLQDKNEKFILMPLELAQVMDMVLKLSRLSRGQSTEHSEVEVNEARVRLDTLLERYEPK